MCLNYSECRTQEVLKRLRRRGTIRCWKVVDQRRDHLGRRYGHLTASFHRAFRWYAGMNQSNRPQNAKRFSKGGRFALGEQVARGIHVFLDKTKALGFAMQGGGVTMPVICKAEDFVAAGNGWPERFGPVAVFTKVRLSEHAYKKALKREEP